MWRFKQDIIAVACRFDDIRLEDLPEECRQIAELIGLPALMELVRARGGEYIYLPKPESLQAAARNREIRKKFNGRNYRELAREHNLTVRWVRAIVDNGRRETDRPAAPVDIQLQLF